MIPNITHSTGSGNYLGYNLGDKREQYQKVQFLAAEGVMLDDRLIDRLNQNWQDGDERGYREFRKVSMQIANDLDSQFLAQASLNSRPKNRAINVSLSYSPADTEKVNEVVYDETRDDYVPLRLKMGREFLDGMGFGDTQYVAVSHLGTHCAHDHYAINTVRADGSTIKLNFDFVRAQKIAEEIRHKYGLSPADESLQMIAPKAKDALKQSCSWEEYEQRLQEHGISLFFSDHSKSGRGYGVSYSAGKKVIPGSKLHRSLSYGQVDAALKKNLLAARKERRLVAERLSTQTETFVIHNDTAATLYSYRPDWNSKDISMAKKLAMLHEASRSILKYHTWGSDVRINEPKEFVDAAVNGKVFGTVKFDLGKARFVGEDRYDGVLENPEEVIQFADHNGRALELFTPKFHEDWGLRLDTMKHYLEERRNDQKAEEAARQERDDIIECYRSAVLPVGKQLYGLKKSAYELYMEAKDSGIGVSAATETVRKQLVETWRQNDEFNRQNREAKDRTDKVTAICGILTCLNPIVGLTAMFLASIVGDIHRASLMAQKKKLLAKVNSLRGELTALEAEKAALKIVKQERLQQYLDAKRMYQEYRNSLQTVDREVKAIESDIRVAEKTPPPAAKPSFEIVLEFKANYYPYRIKKEQDGLLKLQKYEVDKKSPVVDGKHTGHLWYTKEKFTSYEEVGHDANGVYFKIKDTAGKTRFVNQNGIDLDAKKKKQLGLVSKGFGSPTM